MRTLATLIFIFASEVIFAGTYSNEYRGIILGVSSLDEVIDVLGEPISKKAQPNNTKYYFRDIEVTIQDKSGKVNTIIILDTKYIDINGIKIGSPRNYVESKINTQPDASQITDKKNGHVYWFKNNKVSQIVLCYELFDPLEK